MKHAHIWMLLAALAAVALLWRPEPDQPSETTGANTAWPPSVADPTQATVSVGPNGATPSSEPSPLNTALDTPPADLPALEQQLGMLLSQDRFQDAVDLYDRHYGRSDEASQRRHREVILRFADSAARNGDLDRAADLLEIYTGLFFKDVTALSLLAEVLRRDERYDAEIQALHAALNEAHESTDRRRLRDRLDRAVAHAASRMESQQGPPAVIRFYRSLLQDDPLYGPYQIALAHAYLRNNDTLAARTILNAVTDPALLDQASDLQDRLEDRLTNEDRIATTVPLQAVAGGYAVSVILNGRTRATLLIDTGASLTIVSPSVLRRAGVALERSDRQGRFNTVNGVIDAPVARLHSLALAGEMVEHLDVGGIALSTIAGIDGLLGMNFLRRFEFSISEAERVLRLTPLPQTSQQTR